MKNFKQLPLIGILRGITQKNLQPVLEASINAGLGTLEITMNTGDAPALIRKAIEFSRHRLAIGAGTVVTMNDLKMALDAGAAFIVSPVLVPEVVTSCKKKSIPVFPGAFTPGEIYRAWQAGATMVKVFPAQFHGPAYLKAVKGPFRNIPLLACGGVSAESISSFLHCGADGFAFGGSIYKPDWLAEKKFAAIEAEISRLIHRYREALGQPPSSSTTNPGK